MTNTPLGRSAGRFGLKGIIGGLMSAENLGDVHDEINLLCDVAGIPRPEGDFLNGWTEQDWKNVDYSNDSDPLTGEPRDG